MITVYLLNSDSFFIGESLVDPLSALPRCTLTAPPELKGTEVAQWRGGQWFVFPSHKPDFNPATQEVKATEPVLNTEGVWEQQWEIVDLPDEQIAVNRAAARAAAAAQIDEAVAAIYGRFARFQLEYTEREAQAQAYKDAGYSGPVPPRVVEFAIPAGMAAQAATDLILAQAANLRTAQGELSALRMRKYEVLRAATDAEAQTVAEEILSGIAMIGRSIQ